jgi:hypothetical protein
MQTIVKTFDTDLYGDGSGQMPRPIKPTTRGLGEVNPRHYTHRALPDQAT